MITSMYSSYPSTWWKDTWRESMPCGNGEIGLGVYGCMGRERIMINHARLWYNIRNQELPSVSDKLPEARRLLDEFKLKEADGVLSRALEERGYSPSQGLPLPLGDLCVETRNQIPFSHYRRSIDLDKAEVSVTYRLGQEAYARRLFASRKDDAIVMEITGGAPLDYTITFSLHDLRDMPEENKDRLPQHVETRTEENGYILYGATNDDGLDFGGVIRIVQTDGILAREGEQLVVKNATHILLLGKLFLAESNREAAFCRLKEEISRLPGDYTLLMERHAPLHQALLHTAEFSLGGGDSHSNEELLLDAYQGEASDELLEKLWTYGRYLMVCAYREEGLPCNLIGLWNGSYRGFWAIHMLNQNLQEIYWHTLNGNMPHMLLNVFDYYEKGLDELHENARQLFGCRGIFIPAITTPESLTLKCMANHIIYWTGGAAWLCQHYYDYYLYTNDVVFLKNRALPMMYEAYLFYRDFLVLDESGHWKSYPANSPENTASSVMVRGDLEVCVNPTLDFALLRELLTHLAKAAQLTGVHKEEIADFREMYEKIPSYQVNDDGAMKEWLDPRFTDRYTHRHMSQAFPVFPGTEVTKYKNSQWRTPISISLDKRITVGLNDCTSWSLAHMSCAYARLNEGEKAICCLDILTRTCLVNNLFTLHNDWRQMGICFAHRIAPFQIDANMGIVAAINEMLLFSDEGMIELLPALPSRWKNGRIRGLLAKGGYQVNMTWENGTLAEYSVTPVYPDAPPVKVMYQGRELPQPPVNNRQ